MNINLSKLKFKNVKHNMHKFKNKKFKEKITLILVIVFLVAISYVFLYPIIEMLSKTFMSMDDIVSPEIIWVPTSLSFENLEVAWRVLSMPKTLLHSTLFSSLQALFQTIVATLTGYTLARYNFKLKKLVLVAILITFILPTQSLIIPQFMMFTRIREITGFQLIGTVYPQIMMAMFGQGFNSAILILIAYNFFRKIPKDLYEAAQMDGANTLQTFWNITVKLSSTTIFVVFMFAFIWNWNETLYTTTFVRGNVDFLTTQLSGFDALFERNGGANNPINDAYKMAGSLIAITPLIILYVITQRKFVEGIESAGMTGQ